jgi:membrane fusion protein (multidrug efflux system)
MKHLSFAPHGLWALAGLGILIAAALVRGPARLTGVPTTRPLPTDSAVTAAVTHAALTTESASRDAVSLPGTVEARTSEVRPAFDAVVDRVKCELGQVVKKGEVLIQLDDAAARAQLAAAQAHYEDARAKVEAFETASEGAVPSNVKLAAMAEEKSAAAEVILRETALSETQIVAPINGVVARCNVHSADVVNRGSSLITVVEVDPVIISVNIPQRDYSTLRLGQDVQIRSNVLRTQSAIGTVSFISPHLDPSTGTAVVKVALSNDPEELHPGMSVDVQIFPTRH